MICRSKGMTWGTSLPLVPISFNFVQFFGKLGKVVYWRPPDYWHLVPGVLAPPGGLEPPGVLAPPGGLASLEGWCPLLWIILDPTLVIIVELTVKIITYCCI